MTIEEKAKEIVEDYVKDMDDREYYIGARFYIYIDKCDEDEFVVALLDDMEDTVEEATVDERVVAKEGIIEVVEQYLHDTVWED